MPKVDVQFRLTGTEIPVDHGYHLFSAVSELVPYVHENKDVGIHAINGWLAGNRMLTLTARSRLTIRLPAEQAGRIFLLAGKTLPITGHTIHLGTPNSQGLPPRAELYSRLVIVKGFTEPEPFLEAILRQLQALEIHGKPSLIHQPHLADANLGHAGGTKSPYLRRTLRIADKEIVGFALRVSQLTDRDSIRLQEKGLGGKRRFGCGLFIPAME